MKINCDYNECTIKCKNYNICNLHTPSNQEYHQIRQEIKWSMNRIDEINRGINNYRNTLYQIQNNTIPKSLLPHLNTEKIQTTIKELQTEKRELIQSIGSMQIREKNIYTILRRREK